MRYLCLIALTFLLCLASVSMAAQTEGMIAYWKLDEGSGKTAKDSVGGYHGTLEGKTAWGDGKVRGALSFGDGCDYVETTLNDKLQQATEFTMAAWFKANKVPVGQQFHIVWIGQSAGNGWGLEEELHLTVGNTHDNVGVADRLTFYFGGNNVDWQTDIPVYIFPEEPFTDTSNWHHIAGVIRNANESAVEGALYLDGELVGEDISAGDITRNLWNSSFRIGAPGAAHPDAGQRCFNGLIDEVIVWDRALTQEEILGYLAVQPNGSLTTTWGELK